MENSRELREILSKRYPVLAVLLDGKRTKPELVEELELSRSTIDRAVQQLLYADCIERTDVAASQYRISVAGRVTLQTYREYCETLESVQEAAGLINTLPPNAPVSQEFVSTADVFESTKTPDVAMDPAIDHLAESTRMIGTAPVVFENYFEILFDWLDDGDSEMELILEEALLDSIVKNYQTEFAELKGFESVDFYITDEELPYALWIFDPEVCAGITIYGKSGRHGALVSDSIDAIRWARNQYSRYRDSASKLDD